MYNKVTEADLSVLRTIVGADRVLFGDAISPDYSHDELGGISRMPEVLVRVLSTEEISSVMKYAYAHDIPVTVRGSRGPCPLLQRERGRRAGFLRYHRFG